MVVVYRMCGIPSTNPSPIYQEDKFELNKLCLRSFLNAFKDVDIKVVYILDHCDPRHKQFIESIDNRAFQIIESNVGINQTMIGSYVFANGQRDDILFQECDYIYQPGSGKKLVAALDELELLSPYDHPDHYQESNMELKIVGDHHYRKARNNTMTFAIKNKVFKEHYDTFYKYGYLDHDVWDEVSAKGAKLWVPIPSFATHCVAKHMAPSIKWKEIWEAYM